MTRIFEMFMSNGARQARTDSARVNQHPVGLSPTATQLLNQSHFSSDEINRAFAEARRFVSGN